MSDFFDPEKCRRLRPTLDAMRARYFAGDPARTEEVEVSQEEFDVLLDGQPLPTGQQMHFMGKPVVVRKGTA